MPTDLTPYARAVHEAGETLDEALASIRRRQDAGQLTIRQAADERIEALETHLATLRLLRDTFGAGQ